MSPSGSRNIFSISLIRNSRGVSSCQIIYLAISKPYFCFKMAWPFQNLTDFSDVSPLTRKDFMNMQLVTLAATVKL